MKFKEDKEQKVLRDCVDNCPYNMNGTCINGLSKEDKYCRIKILWALHKDELIKENKKNGCK